MKKRIIVTTLIIGTVLTGCSTKEIKKVEKVETPVKLEQETETLEEAETLETETLEETEGETETLEEAETIENETVKSMLNAIDKYELFQTSNMGVSYEKVSVIEDDVTTTRYYNGDTEITEEEFTEAYNTLKLSDMLSDEQIKAYVEYGLNSEYIDKTIPDIGLMQLFNDLMQVSKNFEDSLGLEERLAIEISKVGRDLTAIDCSKLLEIIDFSSIEGVKAEKQLKTELNDYTSIELQSGEYAISYEDNSVKVVPIDYKLGATLMKAKDIQEYANEFTGKGALDGLDSSSDEKIDRTELSPEDIIWAASSNPDKTLIEIHEMLDKPVKDIYDELSLFWYGRYWLLNEPGFIDGVNYKEYIYLIDELGYDELVLACRPYAGLPCNAVEISSLWDEEEWDNLTPTASELIRREEVDESSGKVVLRYKYREDD